jgi:hypothetical protein
MQHVSADGASLAPQKPPTIPGPLLAVRLVCKSLSQLFSNNGYRATWRQDCAFSDCF